MMFALTDFQIFLIATVMSWQVNRPVKIHCRYQHLEYQNPFSLQADKLDHCLPLFFDGLRETQEPYASLAMRGCLDLMDKFGDRVLDVVPQLIMPIKREYN